MLAHVAVVIISRGGGCTHISDAPYHSTGWTGTLRLVLAPSPSPSPWGKQTLTWIGFFSRLRTRRMGRFSMYSISLSSSIYLIKNINPLSTASEDNREPNITGANIIGSFKSNLFQMCPVEYPACQGECSKVIGERGNCCMTSVDESTRGPIFSLSCGLESSNLLMHVDFEQN